MKKNRLRVGLLIDGYTITAWEYSMLQEICKSEYAEIQLLVIKEKSCLKKEPFFKRLKTHGKVFLYEQYMMLEQKMISLSPNAFAEKDIRELTDAPELWVTAEETSFSDRIKPEDISQINNYHIDVFIRLGFRILRGGILDSAKYGVWSFHHGDNNVNRGGPAGVWEVIEQWDETGVVLQVLTEDLDGGFKLFESYSSTDKTSILRNRNNYYWKAKSFIPRKLRELYMLGSESFFDRASETNKTPFLYYNRLYKTPGNLTILKYFIRRVLRSIQEKIEEYIIVNQWVLLFKFESEEKMSKSFFRFKNILPPLDRFWADPFICLNNDRYYLFFEEYIYKKGKGVISVAEINKKGLVGKSEIVLETEYHLSYPFLFEEGDKLYMIPESAQNRTIELYECEEFPLKWKLKKVLMENISAVDATIFLHENKYWMFTNVKTNSGASTWDELFLFHSETLLGNWAPHPMNPIVSDVKKARPAGNIFTYEGKIYRPSQNCSKRYGYGLTLCKINKLSETEYEEEDVQSISPNWAENLMASHTLNSKGKLTVIDAMVKRNKIFS